MAYSFDSLYVTTGAVVWCQRHKLIYVTSLRSLLGAIELTY
jgi:hypothetical protein